ncbi:RNA-binding protein [Candidatus Kaiserbacteria bacterium CG10_big_fil_rev_8_21_14_0_10_51_14]|uniref:RNA-binding protein KhpA n=1 Tax=Candidatus Kaiserbacteria bacterium CG10_big_fil_rev_8_21_14_0_10_51_14 TaxID=1974610 RepID=A0A2H0UBI6_9BACT|nr:MAG: RNA-binding protein [Candidatus Kaiserbacteria bacterium CG10_big_fil_rev_8_21_14_0_10_51_14]
MERDQQFLEYVIKALVDNPDDVKITRTVDEMGVLLTLVVHKDDMGKVIGRSGATAKAIRTVLRVVGMKNDARVNLKIEEPEGSERLSGQGGMGGEGRGMASHNDKPSEPYVRDTTVDDVIKDLKGE